MQEPLPMPKLNKLEPVADSKKQRVTRVEGKGRGVGWGGGGGAA
jgi:hypothetical protein